MDNIYLFVVTSFVFLVRKLPYQFKMVRAAVRPFLMLSNFVRKDLAIEVNGFQMRLNIRDSLFQRGLAFFPKHIDADMVRYLVANIRSGDIFVDAGAHAGYYSMVASRELGKTGQVVAIEADPFNLAYIKENFALNSYCSTAKIISGAVGGSKEMLRLGINRGNRGSNVIEGFAAVSQEYIDVPADSIKGWLEQIKCKRVDVIKLDIEGCEMLALESLMRDFPADCQPRIVLIEINPAFEQSDKILPFLESNGYRVAVTSGDNYGFIRD